VTFVNLEGPLCDGGTTTKCKKSSNCYAFRSPTRYGQYLVEAGVDLASTANNHSGDFGELCRRQTEATLDKLGIAWSGPPGSIATVERQGLRIAMVAFHTATSCNYLNDHVGAVRLVQQAARNHDLVIVSFHGGAEGKKETHVPQGMEMFHGENRGDLRRFARRVIDAGADLVLGHGPHVLRGMEVYKDRLIAYSLGNFATYGRFDLSGPMGVGMILEAVLEPDGRFVGGRIIGTRQEGRGVPRLDPKNRAAETVRQLTAEDFPHTTLRVEPDGLLAVGEPDAP
jgi:poly-gamma-glutamate capsule biosynthesis protein CapA/YwtB (metallophosphatase superfamily)